MIGTSQPHSTLPILTDATFAAATSPGTGLVAVKFTAAWCAPCRVLTPVVETIAREREAEIRFAEMDADTNHATVTRLSVRSLPTIALFRDGALIDRIVGALPVAALRERVGRHLAAEDGAA